ncbi:hypothetical protein ADT26_18390 [Xanthomonas oryzae]|nr:hypothetical protein AXO1947_16170 [Xanthomonas oryzae pv. oryzae]KOR40347.1 hypothetical protein ADT26_18390 [Xanthomonas oryzae]
MLPKGRGNRTGPPGASSASRAHWLHAKAGRNGANHDQRGLQEALPGTPAAPKPPADRHHPATNAYP